MKRSQWKNFDDTRHDGNCKTCDCWTALGVVEVIGYCEENGEITEACNSCHDGEQDG